MGTVRPRKGTGQAGQGSFFSFIFFNLTVCNNVNKHLISS